jgi:capsular polysaccharide biosynthesis protein
MSKKTRKNRNATEATHTNEMTADVAGITATADEPPASSPNRLMALLWGIPLAIIAAALAVRMLTGN